MSTDANELRNALTHYIERNGQGAITEICEMADISRQHLGRFRDRETDMTPAYRRKLYRAIFGEDAPMENEEEATGVTGGSDELVSLIMKELELLLERLRFTQGVDARAKLIGDRVRDIEALAKDIRKALS